MKVLLINDGLVKGGKERRLLSLIKGLENYPDINLELLLFSKRVAYEEVYQMDIPLHFLERKVKKDLGIFSRFHEMCKYINPDIIHSWGSLPSIYALPASKLLGIPLINAMIADAPPRMKFTDKRLLRARLTFPFSSVVLSNSHAGLKAYSAPSGRSYAIHNGFDFTRVSTLISEEEIRHKFGIKTPYIVGMIGAFAVRKDYPTYIKAALNVLEKRDDITFLAVGDGEKKAACEQLVPVNRKDHIIFTGIQNNVESIINVFNIGVLATNKAVHGEGISNAIMEYMALEKPVIATDAGGTNEIVFNDENGYLVEDKDHTAIAKHIEYLIGNPDLAAQMGKNGYDRLTQDFHIDRMIDQFYQLYVNTHNSVNN